MQLNMFSGTNSNRRSVFSPRLLHETATGPSEPISITG